MKEKEETGEMYYKVHFFNPASTSLGFVEGYRTARHAKTVALAYQAQFAKDGNTGINAKYLGKAA